MDIGFDSFYAHFILFLLCCVIYFSLLTITRFHGGRHCEIFPNLTHAGAGVTT